MECRTIEVRVICAKDLKKVNLFTKMNVYITCSISTDPNSVQKSPVHKKGGSDPVWNHGFKFNVNESDIKSNRVGLVFRIVSNRTLGDREIGRVFIPIKEIYENVVAGKDNSGEISVQERFVTYRVETESGKFKGSLEFSYKFGEKFVMAYPAFNGPGPGPGPGPAQSFYPVQGPPPPHGYGYSTRQYGAPAMDQQGGYGYGYPGQMRARRGNGAAMGVGAGLLGGLVLGEMVSDIGGGCDDGIMDGGMFDW